MTSERLTHTHEAYVRRMQMSSDEVFIFVEGGTDMFFYGELAAVALGDEHSYSLTPASVLRGARGKTGLLAFFRHLESSQLLCHNFKDKRTVAVFFLDKDLDDVLAAMLDSPHVVYTSMYHLENYFFSYGDLPRALAAAAEVDQQLTRARVGLPHEWRAAAARCWQQWVELCLTVRMNNLTGPMNFGTPSQMHNVDQPYGPVDEATWQDWKTRLASAAGQDSDWVEARLAEARSIVDNAFNAGQHDLVFKGQWYAFFVRHDASRWFGKSVDVQSFLKILQATVDLAQDWARDMRERLRVVAACSPGAAQTQ